MNLYFSYSDSLAPWLGQNSDENVVGVLQVGWMMEGKHNCPILFIELIITLQRLVHRSFRLQPLAIRYWCNHLWRKGPPQLGHIT